MKKLFSELAQLYHKQGCIGKTVLIIVFFTIASILFSVAVTFLPVIIGFFIIRFIAQKVKFKDKLTKYAVLITFTLFALFTNVIWATVLEKNEEGFDSQNTNQQQPSPEQNEDTSEEQEVTDNSKEEVASEPEDNTETPKEETVPEEIEQEPKTPTYNFYDVVKIVDGDTIKINYNGTTESIRFIGIDTPETVDPNQPVQCFGVEASNKAKELMQNKRVRLEFDSTQGERDKYNRLLAYIFLEDGTHVNYTMIREGYAFEYTYNLPYQYMNEFKEAQRLAREDGKGLWSASTCNGVASAIVTTPEPEPTPTPEPTPSANCKYNCVSPDRDCGDFATHQESITFWNCCGFTATNDPMKLDGTGIDDGIPCESLP